MCDGPHLICCSEDITGVLGLDTWLQIGKGVEEYGSDGARGESLSQRVWVVEVASVDSDITFGGERARGGGLGVADEGVDLGFGREKGADQGKALPACCACHQDARGGRHPPEFLRSLWAVQMVSMGNIASFWAAAKWGSMGICMPNSCTQLPSGGKKPAAPRISRRRGRRAWQWIGNALICAGRGQRSFDV